MKRSIALLVPALAIAIAACSAAASPSAAPTAASTPAPAATTAAAPQASRLRHRPPPWPRTSSRLPPKRVRFKTLLTAVKAAGLVETLQGKGPFTVFAPTDAAFAALPAGTLATASSRIRPLTRHPAPRRLRRGHIRQSRRTHLSHVRRGVAHRHRRQGLQRGWFWIELAPLASRLAEHRRVVLVDWLGFGTSDRPDAPYGYALFGDQLESIRVSALQPGESSVDVVALSLPGQHVVVAAAERPERFGRVVLISPTGLAASRAVPAANLPEHPPVPALDGGSAGCCSRSSLGAR